MQYIPYYAGYDSVKELALHADTDGTVILNCHAIRPEESETGISIFITGCRNRIQPGFRHVVLKKGGLSMDSEGFKKDFLDEVCSDAEITGPDEAFVSKFADCLVNSEVIPDFTQVCGTGRFGRQIYRIDGYVYDELDGTMNLFIADSDISDPDRKLTMSDATPYFNKLSVFIEAALADSLRYEESESGLADLADFMRSQKDNIRKYRLFIFTDAVMSSSITNISLDDCSGIPAEGQIWDLDRLYRVCSSGDSHEPIQIDFTQYCPEGIPCLEASSAETDQYTSYLGVIPGSVIADVYDQYGSRLLEGNVRSFLSARPKVNRNIRLTIMNMPEMFFAFNNGISATAKDVVVETTDHGRFITSARDFQIINGGQTTASISNARYKDKASLDGIYVQMKLTVIDQSVPAEESDQLIVMISRSSNSQNKVNEADFFSSHPFNRRMEQISRRLFAPAAPGAQYETRWFYERARGKYLQEQMHLTRAEKKRFQMENPKSQLITKTDVARVQNTWLGEPYKVSLGGQKNCAAFADDVDKAWDENEQQFNDLYFKTNAALLIMFRYMEKAIPGESWYKSGYRANIIAYTIALFKVLIQKQFPNNDLNLMMIWDRQSVPEPVRGALLSLAGLVFEKITDPSRQVDNVTEWCKKKACWDEVQKISYALPSEIESCLLSAEDQKAEQKSARKERKIDDGIDAQTKVFGYQAQMWKRLTEFAIDHQMVTSTHIKALGIACKMPQKIPNSYQSRLLLALLSRAKDEGFNPEA